MDVSSNGICLLTSHALDSGQLSEVSFNVPMNGGHGNVTAMARSVYSVHNGQDGHQGFKMGMRLVENAARSNTANLHKFVSSGSHRP